jgi:serine/threonine protein kinase
VLSLISFKKYARRRVLRSTIFRGRKTEDVKRFIAEIEILKRLQHDHIVRFIGSYVDTKYIGLIMTPIADGDLAAYMAIATPAKFPELSTCFGCLTTALEYLHSHDICHKDIKPTNILVSNGRVLFADFGLSLDYTDASGSTTMGMADGVTPRYCAPEVARHEPRNTKSDIWCLGIVFLKMIVTLKGQAVRYMDDFFKQHGTKDVFIRLNTAAVPEFITHVSTLSQGIENKPLEWTCQMLLVAQVERPTASDLVTQITAPRIEGWSSRFCGICCVAGEDKEFSDYAGD